MRINLNVDEPICGCDGVITIFAFEGNPPYQYSIDGGITYNTFPNFNNLCGGIYVVKVQDTLGEEVTSSINLRQPSLPVLYDLTYSISSNIIADNGTITTKVTNLSFVVTPALPEGAYITFDFVHSNVLEVTPELSGVSLTTNTILKYNETTLPPSTTSNVSTNFNIYPGCQDQTNYVQTVNRNWSNLTINSTDTYSVDTTSTVIKLIDSPCYFMNNNEVYNISNLKIFNCSCCTIVADVPVEEINEIINLD